MTDGFKSFADFKRRVKAGDRLSCDNYRFPHLSGERTVSKVQSNALAVTTADGREIWWYFTKAADVKIDGRTVTDVTGGSPNFAYHFADTDHDSGPHGICLACDRPTGPTRTQLARIHSRGWAGFCMDCVPDARYLVGPDGWTALVVEMADTSRPLTPETYGTVRWLSWIVPAVKAAHQ